MALKNPKLGIANSSAVANRAYFDALFQEKNGRYGTNADWNAFRAKYPNATVKDAANVVLGLNSVQFKNGSDAQADVDPRDIPYKEAEAANSIIAATAQKNGSTTSEIVDAILKGDLSGLVDWEGKPYSLEDQQKALTDADTATKQFYEQQQQKETADAESALAKKQADYQDYLIQSGQEFQADKTTADQNAADQGVLFSGSRVQKEKNLARAYSQDQATNQRNFATSIGDTARDFQYKYGNAAATGLNKYYNLGSNTYDASKAQGGVTSNSLSSVYNPGSYDFYGTRNKEKKLDVATRSAGYLWNKGNKLLTTGYNNQY